APDAPVLRQRRGVAPVRAGEGGVAVEVAHGAERGGSRGATPARRGAGQRGVESARMRRTVDRAKLERFLAELGRRARAVPAGSTRRAAPPRSSSAGVP